MATLSSGVAAPTYSICIHICVYTHNGQRCALPALVLSVYIYNMRFCCVEKSALRLSVPFLLRRTAVHFYIIRESV